MDDFNLLDFFSLHYGKTEKGISDYNIPNLDTLIGNQLDETQGIVKGFQNDIFAENSTYRPDVNKEIGTPLPSGGYSVNPEEVDAEIERRRKINKSITDATPGLAGLQGLYSLQQISAQEGEQKRKREFRDMDQFNVAQTRGFFEAGGKIDMATNKNTLASIKGLPKIGRGPVTTVSELLGMIDFK